jgi:hypothetical protein
VRIEVVNWVKSDPDLDTIRDNPRLKAMLASAEARLAQSSSQRKSHHANRGDVLRDVEQ